jgi:GDP-4-dehydro-6-deoxy-D-mannose reductase
MTIAPGTTSPGMITPARILITGANGFVGRHLMTALTAAFPRATLLTPAFDVANGEAVTNAIREVTPDACIHLAAISTNAQVRGNEDRAWAVNLGGSRYLARAILAHAPACQLIFASTADAYGASFRPGTKLNESAPLAPLNAYAATKAAADLALGAMVEQGLSVVRLRPFNHTGAGQSSGLVVAAFARQIARIEAGSQEPVINVGNLDPKRDFLNVRDVCAAYVACLVRRDAIEPGAIFNIASGEARRIGDVLDALLEMAGVAVEIRTDATRTRSTDVPLAWCDPARARDVLGWRAGTSWSETLRDVLDDWRRRIAIEPESP